MKVTAVRQTQIWRDEGKSLALKKVDRLECCVCWCTVLNSPDIGHVEGSNITIEGQLILIPGLTNGFVTGL